MKRATVVRKVNNDSIYTVDEWVQASHMTWRHELEQDACQQDEVDVIVGQPAPFKLHEAKEGIRWEADVDCNRHYLLGLVQNGIVGSEAIIELAFSAGRINRDCRLTD